MTDLCKHQVIGRRPCQNKAVKNGLCKIHQPDYVSPKERAALQAAAMAERQTAEDARRMTMTEIQAEYQRVSDEAASLRERAHQLEAEARKLFDKGDEVSNRATYWANVRFAKRMSEKE